MALRAPSMARSIAIAMVLAACAPPTPELAQEHARRGEKALADGRYGEALTAYQHAREMAPQDSGIQRGLMRARAYVMADSPSRVGNDALDDLRYEAQLLLDGDKARAAVYLTALANIAVRRGDLTDAQQKLDEALRLEAGSAIAHTARGTLLALRRETRPQAKAELETAIKLRPDAMAALIGLAQLKLQDGDAAGAIDKLETALRTGDDFGARMALGNARMQQDKAAEAVEQFQRAAQLDPKSADALGALGQALLTAGRVEEAERPLRASAQMRRDSAVEIALGYALARQKKNAAALEVFTRTLADDPSAVIALHGAGVASQELGKIEQAAAMYRQLLRAQSDGRNAMLTASQKDADARLRAIEAAAAPAPSASPSVTPAAPAPKGRDPLLDRR